MLELWQLLRDSFRGLNATAWGGIEEAAKVGRIVKTSITTSSMGISTYNAVEDYMCKDRVCLTLSVVGGTCDTLTLVCGNVPGLKKCTLVTIPISTACKSTRAYCKKLGTLPGCGNK